MNITKLTEIYEKYFLRASGSSSGELQESRGYQIWDMDNPDADPSIHLPKVNFTELLSKLEAVRDRDLIVVVPGDPQQLELDAIKTSEHMVKDTIWGSIPARASFISIEDFKKMKRMEPEALNPDVPGREGGCDVVMYNDVQAKERAARVAGYDGWYTSRYGQQPP